MVIRRLISKMVLNNGIIRINQWIEIETYSSIVISIIRFEIGKEIEVE